MQALQRTFQNIAGQMKALPPTAKMLIGSLMVILVMSLFLVSLYAGKRDMAPLGLGASVSADARAKAVDYLKAVRIPYEVSGNDILVPADQKFTVWAHLTEAQIVGADQINFERLMADDSPFRTRDQNRQRYMVAKMNVLGTMISQMSGIERATVVLDASDGGNAIGRSHIPPSASVTVLTRGGEFAQAQVDAIARLVAGAHAGLKPQHVSIIDARTGRAHQPSTDDVLSTGKYMQVKLDAERHVRSTIEMALGYIAGVRIAVNAQVDAKQVTQQVVKHDEPKIGVLEETSASVSSTGSSGSSEPGVRSNTGMSIASSGRTPASLTDERTTTSSVPFVGTDSRNINDAKGYALQINASIGVPKSYFVRLYKDRNGDEAKQPEPAELDALVQAETDRIKSTVTPLIDTQAMEGAQAGTVSVSMIPDFALASATEVINGDLVGPGAPGGSSTEQLVKYVGLGGLAAISLLMMFIMVRKAGTRERLPTAEELAGIPPALGGADADLVGEADEATPALEGIELTDDSIRRQQMLRQIKDMVSTTPDDAANLMRRWMKVEA